VPPVEEEPLLQPGDTIQWTPGIDSLLDSLRAPVETLPPGPIEIPPASTGDSLSVDSIAPSAPVRLDSSERTEAIRAAGSTPLSP
jgi:hypothetical protein